MADNFFIFQFRYGEDGMDISKAQFFNEKQLNFLKENVKAVGQASLIKQLRKGTDQKEIKKHRESVSISNVTVLVETVEGGINNIIKQLLFNI